MRGDLAGEVRIVKRRILDTLTALVGFIAMGAVAYLALHL
jgi:hypothetical protein